MEEPVQSKSLQGSRADSVKERQLELEIQAFAELLFDFYEYREKEKRGMTPPVDPDAQPLKMRERSNKQMPLF